MHSIRMVFRLFLFTLLILSHGVLKAEVAVPALTAQVVDTTNTLSAAQQTELIEKLASFEQKKGSQIAVLLVSTTLPESIEQYALRVAEKWKIGRTKVDDGAILVVALQDKTLRIEVGYGLEGALTDATSQRIIREIIVPHFRKGDFATGVVAGVDQIMAVIDGEELPEPRHATAQQNNSNPVEGIAPLLFMVAIFVGGFLRKAIGKFPAALATGGLVFVVAWIFAGAFLIAILAGLAAIVLTLFGNVAGMGLGGFGRGRSSGGGFGGGGGGFGGGGASGRW